MAGASLAILLGRQGRRVLLVDRERLPGDTLSTHFLQPGAVRSLARLGALADIEASGVRRIRASARTSVTRSSAALDGADWEAAMTDYHRRRDAAVLPAIARAAHRLGAAVAGPHESRQVTRMAASA